MSNEKESNSRKYKRLILSKRNSLGIANTRRIVPDDLNDLKSILRTDSFETFNEVDLCELLDKSSVSTCLENVEGKIIAAIYLNDHPNIPSIPSWEWDHWLYNLYQLEHMSPVNTLWIHLILFDNLYTYTFLNPLLKSVFENNTSLEYIIMVIPPGVPNTDWLNNLGTKVAPTGYSEPNKVQTLYLLIRQHFVKRYKIRRAVEEDNDDLVPLINTYSDRLVEHYGDFYIAEILTRHPDAGRQLIVAEYAEHAVALLCLTDTVNIGLLSESFELIPFYNLKKPHEDDILPDFGGATDGLGPTLSLTSIAVISKVSNKSSADSIELAIGESEGELETSEDDYSIANLSSLNLLYNHGSDEEEESETENNSGAQEADFSAVILSFDDYEMHLFADRTRLQSLSFDDLEQHFLRKLPARTHTESNIFFYGEINAFTLELAVSELDHEIESLHLLLEAAFECFPERDYCVLALPSTCPPTPLINHFIKVPPKPSATYPHELYILHRNSILSHISVRLGNHLDVRAIENLLTYMDKTQKIYNDFVNCVARNNCYTSYVLLSEKQAVGIAMLKEADDFPYLKSHYDVSEWIDDRFHKTGSFGIIEHLVISPLFQKNARFFLREIHRLSDYSILFYCLSPNDSSANAYERPLCSALSDLIAVKPRQIPELNLNDIDGCFPEASIYQTNPPFALYLSTPRHSSIERMEVNKKIVIVGSSDTALAFLDSLLSIKNTFYKVIFTNVTLVSPHGLNYQQIDNKIRDMMFVTKNFYNNRHMQLVSMKTYVNVINAVMTGIDRKNKLLLINESKKLPYDYLFLMCGRQFQKPSAALIAKSNKSPLDFPENVFLINTEVDATNSLIKLKDMVTNKDSFIIVYGNSLEAYCCLAALLEFGIKGKRLVFVEPFPAVSERKVQRRVSFFNNGDVDEAIQEAIANEGVAVYPSFYFTAWEIDEATNKVTSVQIQSCCRQTNIKCLAMFMYNDKTVSARTFLSVNKAGLVFDGALVVQPDCKTNDPNIYAAGTITKYSRRFYADHLAHQYFNVEEIGSKLALNMRKKLIPFYDEDVDPGPMICKSDNMLVPVYDEPIMNYCELPGNLKYLSVRKPGKPVPLETAMNSADYGQAMVTGDCTQLDEQGYFRLHINANGLVETITCLSKINIDFRNIASIWGKHETLLNNLQLRFEMMMIKDLFEYFHEPWSFAIYYDRFSRFENDVKDIIIDLTKTPGNSLIEDLMKLFRANGWRKLNKEQNESMQEKFMGSTYHSALERRLLDFIKSNEDFLSMYAHRDKVRLLLEGCQRSALFQHQ